MESRPLNYELNIVEFGFEGHQLTWVLGITKLRTAWFTSLCFSVYLVGTSAPTGIETSAYIYIYTYGRNTVYMCGCPRIKRLDSYGR